MTAQPSSRLIVVSNRLPYVRHLKKGEKWALEPGSGGLVTALLPVLRDRGGTWIGWSGVTENVSRIDDIFRNASRGAGYELRPVSLSQEEVDKYYHGYSNETLWPLFHDLQSRATFDSEYWHTYVKVNRKFAETLAGECTDGDFVWIHDYQMADVAHHLREMGCQANLGYFLHIPFPSPDIFMKLPERHALLTSLLAYDLVGFQTVRDRRNFLQCVRMLMKNARVRPDGHLHVVHVDDRDMRVGNFPIGIDAAGFAGRAGQPEVEERVRSIKERFAGRQIVLGIDRLDYTKGIPERLRAFSSLLERFPEVHERIHYFQVVIPSRTGIPEYDELKMRIERLVAEINGRFSKLGWVPIHYFFRSLPPDELLAFYRASDIALITPLKDGMNLVAKEYCACSLEETSVLILSQFAGAAAQLGSSALVVNPYDVEQTADALYHAFRMPAGERRYRIRRLRRNVHGQDVFWWVDSFMQAAIHKELKDFPLLEDYIPEHHENIVPSER
ncbi:MAG: trehalose-6-phosphate synthase [Actinobacteria bacterium]|nr:trehalose-6-phosphate synthase [Actinomycetota bacterium]